MKAEEILNQAAGCKNEAGADALRGVLQQAFVTTKALGHLRFDNSEAYMEGDKPFVRFELNRVISQSYITMIRPEVRDGQFVVFIVTNRILDGLGMGSQSWEVVGDLETLIDDIDETETISSVASRAKEIAIQHHAELIESVGVPKDQALRTAKKSW